MYIYVYRYMMRYVQTYVYVYNYKDNEHAQRDITFMDHMCVC